jgi:hypothetical protein
VDYWLLQDSPVTLVWSATVLAELTAWLTRHGYTVVSVDTSGWTSHRDLHRDIAAALDFPDYYGRNFNALDDCLFDVAHGAYGLDPTATGLVLVLERYDRFSAIDAESAHALLDYFAQRARLALLFGHRMICLVQSDNPRQRFPDVGATEVRWNQREWADFRRNL